MANRSADWFKQSERDLEHARESQSHARLFLYSDSISERGGVIARLENTDGGDPEIDIQRPAEVNKIDFNWSSF
ncbi:hypothetical protein ACFL27_00300 [candidate division CSSED10-310 bacterium]|uniref:Uncharacterized protein n=1 Tax=candidate division CSSED10-310 bacterium TaxID=2855610 RepID=A0ABV6YRE8_UNCC1